MADTLSDNCRFPVPAFGQGGWNTELEAIIAQLDSFRAIGALCVGLAEYPSASLNVTVAAGTFGRSDGIGVATYAGTAGQALAASATSYIYLTETPTLVVNTAGFPAGVNILPLAIVTTGPATVTSIVDARRPWSSSGGHRTRGAGTPTLALGGGAGTSPGTPTVAGSDEAGLLTIVTGTAPATLAAIVTVTFGVAYAAAPRAVLVTPANAAAAALAGAGGPFVDGAGVSASAWTLGSGATAPAASTAYKWWYSIEG